MKSEILQFGNTNVSGSTYLHDLTLVYGSSVNNPYAGKSVSTIGSDGTINQALLGDLSVYSTIPQYSAFAPGPCGIRWNGNLQQPIIERVTAGAGLKIGVVIDQPNGHVQFKNCILTGVVAGVYPLCQGEGYDFTGGSVTGGICNFLLGTNAPVPYSVGFTGFGQSNWTNVYFGQSAYRTLQVQDSLALPTACGGLYAMNVTNCSVEAIGEAWDRLLPCSTMSATYSGCGSPPGYSGDYVTGYNLPSGFTMSAGHGAFAFWCGQVSQFTWLGIGTAAWNFNGLALGGTLICQGFNANGAAPNFNSSYGKLLRPDDLAFFGPSGISYVNSAGTVQPNFQGSTKYPNFLDNNSLLGNATKNILCDQKSLIVSRNLLKNPEVAANWVTYGSGNTVTTMPFASITGAVTAQSGWGTAAWPLAMRNEFDAMGLNPVVTLLNGGGTPCEVTLPVVGSPLTLANNQNIGFSFWAYNPGGAAYCDISGGAAGTDYTSFGFGSGWTKVWYYGKNINQNFGGGANSLGWLTINCSGTGITYLCGVQVFTGEIGAYNPLNAAYATSGLAIGNSALALAAAAAPSLTTDAAGDLIITAAAGASVVQNCGTVDASTQTIAPVTGATVTVPSGCATYFINPAGTLAALTVALPSAPTTIAGSSFKLDVCFTQAITALTVSASGPGVVGATLPAGVAAGAVLTFRYAQGLNKWVHVVPV